MKKSFLLVLLSFVLFVFVSAQSHLSGPDPYLANLLDKTLVFDTASIDEHLTGHVDAAHGWKAWETVDNYSFGKNRGALPMIADLESLHPYFRDRIKELVRQCKAAGIELAVVETYRTHAKQSEYYAMGKKYTSTSGGKSRHQYGLAVDVVPVVNEAPVWDNQRLWRKIGVMGERLGLRWGGRWRAPYDPAHFEWSGGVTISQLEKGSLPKIPMARKEHYPCIEEEIAQLQDFWSAWEMEQSVMANNNLYQEATGGVIP